MMLNSRRLFCITIIAVIFLGTGLLFSLRIEKVEAQSCPTPTIQTPTAYICQDGGDATRTVSCPMGTIRLSCSGSYGDLQENEEIWRIWPTGNDSCSMRVRNNSCSPSEPRRARVTAYCLGM